VSCVVKLLSQAIESWTHSLRTFSCDSPHHFHPSTSSVCAHQDLSRRFARGIQGSKRKPSRFNRRPSNLSESGSSPPWSFHLFGKSSLSCQRLWLRDSNTRNLHTRRQAPALEWRQTQRSIARKTQLSQKVSNCAHHCAFHFRCKQGQDGWCSISLIACDQF